MDHYKLVNIATTAGQKHNNTNHFNENKYVAAEKVSSLAGVFILQEDRSSVCQDILIYITAQTSSFSWFEGITPHVFR